MAAATAPQSGVVTMTTRHLRGSDDLAHDRRKRPMASDILAVSRRAGLSDRPTEKIGEPWLLILLLQRPTGGLPGDLAFQAQDLSEMTMLRFNSYSFIHWPPGRPSDLLLVRYAQLLFLSLLFFIY